MASSNNPVVSGSLGRPLHPFAVDWLRLTLQPGVSLARLRQLLVLAQGDVRAVPDVPLADLQGVLPPEVAVALKQSISPAVEQAIQATLAWAGYPGNTLIVIDEDTYPAALRELHDPPPILYVRGQVEVLAKPAVAVVGSRHATPAGCELAHTFAQSLAEHGWCVVSGLALGVDGAAHEGALAAGLTGGGTLGVMATGADRLYPARHQGLAQRMLQNGALLTELPLGTPSASFQFPRRNRLVAGLVKGVVVVEAAERSGSLITARLAAEAGRDVFAVPGSVHAPLARGCHELLRQGAILAASLDDILSVLEGPTYRYRRAAAKVQGANEGGEVDVSLSPSDIPVYQAVWESLGHDPIDVETLLQRAGVSSAQLMALLSRLELAGRLVRTADGRLQRLNPGTRP